MGQSHMLFGCDSLKVQELRGLVNWGLLQKSRLAGAHLINPDCVGEAGLSF